MPDRHEVWVELVSGSRVQVGKDLPDHAAASEVARHWKSIAESATDRLYESMPKSGTLIRGSAIVAIKAQVQGKPGMLEGVLKADRANRL